MAGFIKLIWAQAMDRGIGRNGQLLFRLKEDTRLFKEKTTGCVVIMGRKTYDSLPNRQPLPDRYNVVLSRNPDFYECADNIEVVSDVHAFIAQHQDKKIWIIGGAEVYKETLGYAQELHVTNVLMPESRADAFAPEVDFRFWQEIESSKIHVDTQAGLSYWISVYKPKKKQILHLKKTI